MNTEEKNITNWREFFSCLKDVRVIIKWALRITDSPVTRPLFIKKLSAYVVVMALGLLQPAVMQYIFTGVIQKNERMVYVALGVICTLLVFQRLAVHLLWKWHEYLFGPALENINRYLTIKFLEKSPGQHKSIKGLNHESVTKAKNQLFELYINLLPELIETLSLIVISYIFIWFVSLVAGVAFTVLIALHLLWSLLINYRAIVSCPIIEKEFSAFERYMVARWRYAERVIVSAKTKDEIVEMRHRWSSVIDKDRTFWLWHLTQTSVRGFTDVLIFMFIVTYGSIMVLNGNIESIGVLYPLFAWSSVIKDNLWRLTQIQRNITGMIPSISVAKETIEIAPDVTDLPNAVALNSSGPLALEFKDVVFGYGATSVKGRKPGEHTIRGVSFMVPRGKRVALIGPSGSGKSTLHYLILRFMNLGAGSIHVNGKDVREYTLASLRRAIAYIPQHAQIFDGTVRDNLLYALSLEDKKEWNDPRLLELLSVLAIDFGRRPKGENPLDIVVGRDGVQLSGGQAQRLVIGAAVVKNPRLLLIDEATSHLDSTTERAVLDGLERLVSAVTTVVIAHRLSTVKLADQVVVLKDGSVEAIANSFQELASVSPTFQRLATDQNLTI